MPTTGQRHFSHKRHVFLGHNGFDEGIHQVQDVLILMGHLLGQGFQQHQHGSTLLGSLHRVVDRVLERVGNGHRQRRLRQERVHHAMGDLKMKIRSQTVWKKLR